MQAPHVMGGVWALACILVATLGRKLHTAREASANEVTIVHSKGDPRVTTCTETRMGNNRILVR